jgi:hypothetical protein
MLAPRLWVVAFRKVDTDFINVLTAAVCVMDLKTNANLAATRFTFAAWVMVLGTNLSLSKALLAETACISVLGIPASLLVHPLVVKYCVPMRTNDVLDNALESALSDCESVLSTVPSLNNAGCTSSDCAIDLADDTSLATACDTPTVACATTIFISLAAIWIPWGTQEKDWLNDLTAVMNLADMSLAAMPCAAERMNVGMPKPFRATLNACDSCLAMTATLDA